MRCFLPGISLGATRLLQGCVEVGVQGQSSPKPYPSRPKPRAAKLQFAFAVEKASWSEASKLSRYVRSWGFSVGWAPE